MARTFKDQKTYPKYQKKRREPLSTQYASYLRNGPDVVVDDPEVDFGVVNLWDPGDFCPFCGEATNFERGFLHCEECGWIDVGADSIEIEEAA